MKGFPIFPGLEWEPLVFDFFPEELNGVEFRGVSGEKVKEESFFLPLPHLFDHGFGGVGWGVVDDNDAGDRENPREGVKSFDKKLGVDVFEGLEREKAPGLTPESRDVDFLFMVFGNGDLSSSFLPGVRSPGVERETRLVKVEQVTPPLGLQTLKNA